MLEYLREGEILTILDRELFPNSGLAVRCSKVSTRETREGGEGMVVLLRKLAMWEDGGLMTIYSSQGRLEGFKGESMGRGKRAMCRRSGWPSGYSNVNMTLNRLAGISGRRFQMWTALSSGKVWSFAPQCQWSASLRKVH